MKTVMCVIGTRPEAIKMAPVVLRARECGRLRVVLCATGQHQDMLHDGLDAFALIPDVDLEVMQKGQSLTQLTSQLLLSIDNCLSAIKPDAVLVQGDTQTCYCGAQAAFLKGIPVGHVEAGLRTKSRRNPFPEEMNRRFTDLLSDWHFAPTPQARQNLLGEGIPDSSIIITGNTAIDALLLASHSLRVNAAQYVSFDPNTMNGQEIILVTGHRRENHGAPIENLCKALRDVVRRHDSSCIVYPVHMNPNVQRSVHHWLGGLERVHLIPPQPYLAFVDLMRRASIIVTDSGGIQEEAPSLGKQVLVTRVNTERPEVLLTGCVRLVGNSQETICSEILKSLKNGKGVGPVENPCGDGRAAQRIVEFLEARLK